MLTNIHSKALGVWLGPGESPEAAQHLGPAAHVLHGAMERSMPAMHTVCISTEAMEWILRRKPGWFTFCFGKLCVCSLLTTVFLLGRSGFSLHLGGGHAGAQLLSAAAAGHTTQQQGCSMVSSSEAGWARWQDLSIQSSSHSLTAAKIKCSLKNCSFSSKAGIKKS